MKALTVKQPYATLIMNGVKKYEMRNWKPTSVEFALHAAAVPVDTVDLLNSGMPTRYWDGLWQPLGCVLGVVRINRVIDTETMPDLMLFHWNNGLHPLTYKDKTYRYAWQLEVVEVFKNPIPARGRLGLWNWQPPDAIARVVALAEEAGT